MDSSLLKIAHRGFNGKDNSKIAIMNAIDKDFDMIEIDIRKTKDNQIILCHDMMIEELVVEETNIDVLKSRDNKLITLRETFSYYHPSHYSFYLDLKGTEKYNNLATLLINFLKSEDIDCSKMVIASVNQNYLMQIYYSNLGCKIGFITNNMFHPYCYTALLYHAHILIVEWSLVNSDTIVLLKSFNKPIYVYTCKSYLEYKYLKKFPINGIISDILLD